MTTTCTRHRKDKAGSASAWRIQVYHLILKRGSENSVHIGGPESKDNMSVCWTELKSHSANKESKRCRLSLPFLSIVMERDIITLSRPWERTSCLVGKVDWIMTDLALSDTKQMPQAISLSMDTIIWIASTTRLVQCWHFSKSSFQQGWPLQCLRYMWQPLLQDTCQSMACY